LQVERPRRIGMVNIEMNLTEAGQDGLYRVQPIKEERE
jgi:hypothetical protein